jgi:hypothetical protein
MRRLCEFDDLTTESGDTVDGDTGDGEVIVIDSDGDSD